MAKVTDIADFRNKKGDKMICPHCGSPMDKFSTKHLESGRYRSYIICQQCEKVYSKEE